MKKKEIIFYSFFYFIGILLSYLNIISIEGFLFFVGAFSFVELYKFYHKNNSPIKFEKVSYEQFKKDFLDTFGKDIDITNDEEAIDITTKEIYERINLPTRATSGSAGYDFYSTVDFSLYPNETIKIPTGIRATMPNDICLKLYPRSGLGFKYRLQLNNTVGIVDSDYYFSDNEGHIFIKITNDSNEEKHLDINEGDAFAQGIFEKYYLTNNDTTVKKRNGGFGSTSKN